MSLALIQSIKDHAVVLAKYAALLKQDLPGVLSESEHSYIASFKAKADREFLEFLDGLDGIQKPQRALTLIYDRFGSNESRLKAGVQKDVIIIADLQAIARYVAQNDALINMVERIAGARAAAP